MTKTSRDWILERNADAAHRLDAIRKAVLAPERPTPFEIVLELFRPNMPAWTALGLAWLLLVAIHVAYSPPATHFPGQPAVEPDPASLTLTHDETLSGLDPHS
jgi:hypothetical protein